MNVGGLHASVPGLWVGAVLVGEGVAEAGWDVCAGVGALRSTCEAGEPTRRVPVEGRGRCGYGTVKGNDVWESKVPAASHRDLSG